LLITNGIGRPAEAATKLKTSTSNAGRGQPALSCAIVIEQNCKQGWGNGEAYGGNGTATNTHYSLAVILSLPAMQCKAMPPADHNPVVVMANP
jgi:hypothetical protein